MRPGKFLSLSHLSQVLPKCLVEGGFLPELSRGLTLRNSKGKIHRWLSLWACQQKRVLNGEKPAFPQAQVSPLFSKKFFLDP